MSKGARKKRATRPWQDPAAMRNFGDLLTPASGTEELELDGYEVRRIDPGRAAKDYICPECGNVVPVGEGHVVVWPVSDADLRRHWHRHCWRLEVRRETGAAGS
ncbi:MAG: ATP/GTP-binding protein [Euzebyales bacterium]|nr:ATP/GTP-binding protein [Euzebyales bacterium]MBA3620809.1 ATP/GTP-binding protein [Euzebyales bacterium]